MSKLRTKMLLRECIQEILKEDDYGGGGYDSPYGIHFASNEQMYNIFIKPFVDVVGVAAGKTKELSQKAQTVLKVAFTGLMTTLIPVLTADYESIFKEEKQEIDKIRSEYSSVYNATWEAFKNNDLLVAAFAYRPDLFLSAAFARKAPQATAKLLSVVSGGTLDNVLHKFVGNIEGSKSEPLRSGPGMPIESVIYEKDDEQDSATEKLAKLVSHKKVKHVLASSPVVTRLSRTGQELVDNTLASVLEQAEGVLSATSAEDLQAKLGKKLPGMEKLQQVPEQERRSSEQELLKTVKKSMREFYVKQLEAQVQEAIAAGVPQDHPFIGAYRQTISKIKSI